MKLLAGSLPASAGQQAAAGGKAGEASVMAGLGQPPEDDPARLAGPDGRPAVSLARLSGLVTSIATAPRAWRPVVRFSREHRWFSRIALTDEYEIWLLSWLPGQHTGFHDHGMASGAFAVCAGELRETLAVPGGRRVSHRAASQGSLTAFRSAHLHDVANAGRAPAVSVHAYSPPLTAMRRYQMTPAGLTLVGTDRAEVNW